MLKKLFKETFLLSAVTMGGGYVIVSIMQKKFVQEYGWLEEEEMLDLVAIAQSAPGAVVINTSIAVGYRLAGVIGAVVAMLGTVLPPMLILMGTFLVYDSIKDNDTIRLFMQGMQIGATALVIDVVLTMLRGLYAKRSVVDWLIFAGAAIMVIFYHVNVLMVVLSSIVFGTLLKLIEKRVVK
ncbi:chromate transporter [Carnobacteriaceae bacterium zg-ZUI252]|nr:chromate transporter [Carnobacteriaceae bacterium zg-ZUI252]MBS4770771.1 chromate transporter [Carnobacteriaceae bacterium zg-ZUI240]